MIGIEAHRDAKTAPCRVRLADTQHDLTMPNATRPIPALTESDKARFFAKINKDGPTMPHMDTPCWVWTAGKGRRGYGSAGSSPWGRRFKTSPAHRLSYICYKGEIPKGLFVCHTCDNPPCINPEHLFLGTHRDNMKDMYKKQRDNHPGGESSHKAKLTKEEAIYILKNMETISAWELSTKFNVSRQTIQNIWHGITKYIEPELREEIIKELTQPENPKPKYGTGEQVWFLNDEFLPEWFFIESIDFDEEYLYGHPGVTGAAWLESQIYPSRESLIDAQIDYWQKLFKKYSKEWSDRDKGLIKSFVSQLKKVKVFLIIVKVRHITCT